MTAPSDALLERLDERDEQLAATQGAIEAKRDATDAAYAEAVAEARRERYGVHEQLQLLEQHVGMTW
jgi:hypothetical protein